MGKIQHLSRQLLLPQNSKRILIILICIAWVAAFLGAYDFSQQKFYWGEAVESTGGIAFKLILFTIFISLAQKITALHFPQFSLFSKLLPLRKYTGIFAFLVTLTHGLSYFAQKKVLANPEAMMSLAFSTKYAAVFGTIAFLIMLPLFLTSTNFAVKKMGYKSWKNLQRFTHAVFIFAVLHVALLKYFWNGKIDFGPIVLFSIYVIGYGYLWHKKISQKNS